MTDAGLTEVIIAERGAPVRARRMWQVLHRAGQRVGRCRVERLKRTAGLAGAVRGRTKRTMIAAKDGLRSGDLVIRAFTASAPNATWVGFVYVAFVIDVYSRMIVG